MSLSADDSLKTYPGNGVAVTFDGPRLFNASHLTVQVVDDTTLVATVPSYSVANVGGNGPARITLTAPHVVGTTLQLRRTVPIAQEADFTNQQTLLRRVVEATFDIVVMMIQQLKEITDRSLHLGPNVIGVSTELPPPSALAPIVWNSTATGLENGNVNLSGDLLLRGNLAAAGAGQGSDLVKARDTTATAYLKTVSDILAGERVNIMRFVNPTQIAAIRNRTTVYDATADLQTALNTCDAIEVPDGVFRHSGLTSTGRSLDLRGTGPNSTLLYTGSGTSLAITPGDINKRVSISGFRFEPAHLSAAGTAISLTYPTTTSYTRRVARLENLELSTFNVPGSFPYWNKGIVLSNAWGIHIRDVYATGKTNDLTTSLCFIEFGVNCLEALVEDCHAYFFNDAVLFTGYCEGTIIKGNNFVSVTNGVRNSAASINSPIITNNHISASKYCVLLKSSTQHRITDNLLYTLFNGALSVILLEDSSDGLVADNTCWTLEATSAGINVANNVATSARNNIHDNACYGGAHGVYLGAGTVANKVRDTSRYDSPVTGVEVIPAVTNLSASNRVNYRGTKVRAWQSVLQNIPITTFTKVTFTTEDFDTENEFAASRFTAKLPGYYAVSASVHWAVGVDGERHAMMIYKNGAEHTRLCDALNGGAGNQSTAGNAIISMVAGDYLEVYVYSSAARDTVVGTALTYFSVSSAL